MAKIVWDASSRLIVVTGLADECDSFEALGVRLGALMNERRISGIAEINNESTEHAAVLTVQLKRDANAQVILDAVNRHLATGEGDA